MDSSYALKTVLEQHDVYVSGQCCLACYIPFFSFVCVPLHNNRPGDLVGELQFSFLCFLVGQSLEAFEHWKQLVSQYLQFQYLSFEKEIN